MGCDSIQMLDEHESQAEILNNLKLSMTYLLHKHHGRNKAHQEIALI